ncbi:hypothetical protein K7432_003801 [Basidiobolus ranarum]|uniref:Uncharacterized protein n=1 Tax=Basidiobolus ranarum TaxID=34480 RepID=A0ABR2W616_9FUNG
MATDVGSAYSNLAPYDPFTTHSPSQMMMTPPTPNTGNTFQNPSPYMMSGISESSNATPEIFSNGMNSVLNSPTTNDVGSQGQQSQAALPRMNQLPVGLNIHNVQSEADDAWSRSRNNSAASVGSYHSGNAYNSEENNGYHHPVSISNSAFNNYDNGENKSQMGSMNQDRFGGHDTMNNQNINGAYHPQDYSNNLQWQGHHSNGYTHESERQIPSHPMQPHYSYNTPHQAK